ncbi:beta-lactamase [Nonomuraea polychroma]|uniref:Beta-lactamase n=1 Tax=Nonomuraea polychroma TaxID=46176 RepID=A0A438LYT9_9ACTN|nr:serine hydrolase [Nonomuraea polychroma]RVX38696.1 beta-lactamase [Nonomuraea polychroma]
MALRMGSTLSAGAHSRSSRSAGAIVGNTLRGYGERCARSSRSWWTTAGLRESLARAAPEYVPGTSLGEHALTYGHLVDGILRASAGTTLGEMFNDVVRPALSLDAWFAVPDQALDRVADLEYADPEWPRLLHAAPWLQIPGRGLGHRPDQLQGLAAGGVRRGQPAHDGDRHGGLLSHLTSEDGPVRALLGPVRALLGPQSHAELLAPQVTDFDDVFGTRITWTLGFVRDQGKIAKGGIGGSAAWWSRKHHHGCAYLTRRLDDHSRAAEIAAALGDDLTVVGED